MSTGVLGQNKRGLKELGAEEKVDWDEVTQGVALNSFVGENENAAFLKGAGVKL